MGGENAFLYNRATGQARDLGHAPFYTFSEAAGASGDGSVVVGTLSNTLGGGGQAFRWTAATGLQGMGSPFDAPVFARGVSRDGRVIVGERDGLHARAYTWTEAGGFQYLPSLPERDDSGAYGVSPDGSIVVGRSGIGDPAMWTNGQVRNLGLPPGVVHGACTAVNADGTIAVGYAYNGSDDLRAYVWSAATGPRFLDDMLTASGLELPTGWRLERLTGISDDGQTFAGFAEQEGTLHRQGFVATIPAPSSAISLVCGGAVDLLRRRRK